VAVSKMTGRGIYDHGDVLRHSKIRIKNPENEVIATYCVRGFKKTKVGYYILRSIGTYSLSIVIFIFLTEIYSLLSLSVLTNMITSIFLFVTYVRTYVKGEVEKWYGTVPEPTIIKLFFFVQRSLIRTPASSNHYFYS
jgi:hypothetical protein